MFVTFKSALLSQITILCEFEGFKVILESAHKKCLESLGKNHWSNWGPEIGNFGDYLTFFEWNQEDLFFKTNTEEFLIPHFKSQYLFCLIFFSHSKVGNFKLRLEVFWTEPIDYRLIINCIPHIHRLHITQYHKWLPVFI
jgi:hypothetical protein